MAGRRSVTQYIGELPQRSAAIQRMACAERAKWNDSLLVAATHPDLLEFLACKVSARVKASTTSRELSSLKRFYRFLLRQGRIQTDPSLNIDTPKLPRSLPASLTEADVEALLDAPDVEHPLGLRDRTMLEVLYASGLRVSELISLEVRKSA